MTALHESKVIDLGEGGATLRLISYNLWSRLGFLHKLTRFLERLYFLGRKVAPLAALEFA